MGFSKIKLSQDIPGIANENISGFLTYIFYIFILDRMFFLFT